MILNLSDIRFHAVVFFGVGKDFMLKSVQGRCAVRCCTNFTLCYQCVDIDLNAAAAAAAALMAAAEHGRTSTDTY